MKIKIFWAAAALLGTTSLPLLAAEHFVTKQGNDAKDGTTEQTAFLTIQKGVNALQAGDTLTIGPGEYPESVTRDGLGSLEAETTIRAALPGTVLLRGDVSIPSDAFKKVDGYRYIYAAPFEQPVRGVNEVDTLTRLEDFSTLGELEYSPGTSYYDAKTKRIYISTSDLQPPSAHAYTVCVIEGSGLMLTNPRRVTVDGLAATGFRSNKLLPSYPNHYAEWGIMLAGARQCVIRHCVAYFNDSGLSYDSGASRSTDGKDNGWNLFENCVAFSNGSKFAPEAGNIIGFTSNHDEMRDCYAYLGYDNNLRFYGAGIRGPAVMKNNVAWGGTYTDIFIKGGEAPKYGMAENCITLGILHSHNLKNSIVGNINQYQREPGKDDVYGLYSPLGNEDTQQTLATRRDQWFADAENLDFRLQATSPLRGSGSDGGDRGPFPYQPNIFYLAPNGNDQNDGLSTEKPWQTLVYAMERLRPGDTLYLEGGTYEAAGGLKISNPEGGNTSIRGRGAEMVLIRGDIAMTDSRGLEFERLNFTGALTLADCRDIRFNNCRFSNLGTPLSAASVQNLKVTHSEFTGFQEAALNLEKCRQVWLSSTIFDNRQGPAIETDRDNAIQFSDYNVYANPALVWRVGGKALDFPAWQTRHDKYSQVRNPKYTVENGFPRLQNAAAFGGDGALGHGAGFYRAYRQREMKASAPVLHSVSTTTADLEWWTSVPAITEVAWGETPDTPNKITFNEQAKSANDCFNTLSLTGLKPGTKYYFRLKKAKPLDQNISQYTKPTPFDDAPLSFLTASTRSVPRELYVAPDGNDHNSGLSREQAWKTVAHASDAARAGDTVFIAGGTYQESVRVRASGSADQPITFKAVPGEKVVFDGNNRSIVTAFSVVGKQHIHFDGLYFRQFGSEGWKSVLDLRQSQHLKVTRCFFNAIGSGTSGVQVRTDQCADVTIRNCVIARGFQGMYFRDTKALHIENNVFVNNLICAILNSGGDPGGIEIKKNIFVDSIPSKVKVQLFEVGGFDQYVFDQNAFYLRIPDKERQPFLFYGTGPGRTTVADYDKKTGLTNFIVNDPQFAISEGQEAVNREGQKVEFLGDWIPRHDLDFPDLFTRNPMLITAKIGLQPDAFEDFSFSKVGNDPAMTPPSPQ